MAEISRYGKIALGLAAGFLLFSGGYFLASSEQTAQPYGVVSENRPSQEELTGTAPAPDASSPEETRPDSLLPGEVIDVNTASAADLTRLPGIGESRAQAIVAWREEQGPFQSVDELVNVSGIGEGILEDLRPYVTAGR